MYLSVMCKLSVYDIVRELERYPTCLLYNYCLTRIIGLKTIFLFGRNFEIKECEKEQQTLLLLYRKDRLFYFPGHFSSNF